MADLEELEYVSYRVWPNENTLKIWNDRELIHYDGQHPVFGDKYEPHEEVSRVRPIDQGVCSPVLWNGFMTLS
jgi:hypothetical protein